MNVKESEATNKESSSNTTNSENAVKKKVKTDNAHTSTTRLTSFRVPRDLTLGGNIKTDKVKKIYTPNLNVQRKKKGEAETPAVKIDKDKDIRQKHVREQKQKKPNNLIQSMGVFSEGLSELTKKKFSRSGYSRESSSDRSDTGFIEKPKLNAIPTINKEEEDERLRLILRDDFIDDNKEIILENLPTILPLNNTKCIYATNYTSLVQKSEHKTEVDIKPIIMENGEIKKSSTKSSPKIKYEEKIPSVLDALESKTNLNYIFMQFPTCLPLLRAEDDITSNTSSKKQAGTSTSESNNKSKNSDCVLNDIKEGYIGKMQILRSGKARLILGGHMFNVEKGTSTTYRQDLVAIKINEEEKSGDLINLGPINHTFIVSIDVESLLNET